MGVGKSTVGRLLSARLGFQFLDTDALIEERCGANIPWIFDVEGEAGFRVRESQALLELQERKSAVIATGGGIVVTPQNIPLLKSLGTVFFLTASVDQLVARTSRDKKRPLLQVDNPRKRIEELIALRDPLYRSVADYVITTDIKGTKGVVGQIMELIK
ncbi:MAG: shikimate kinase [Moraxellaceae bacterium]|jgi:shikimate kinase|nr:MAG: shikimate kinase [Moraxellaceae bacterium]